LKERLINKDDKNRHFVLLIIDISKHGAKEMGHVKMTGPNSGMMLQHDDPVLFQKNCPNIVCRVSLYTVIMAENNQSNC
jgi:hypothetical protein